VFTETVRSIPEGIERLELLIPNVISKIVEASQKELKGNFYYSMFLVYQYRSIPEGIER